jgi:hypothetical protein
MLPKSMSQNQTFKHQIGQMIVKDLQSDRLKPFD